MGEEPQKAQLPLRKLGKKSPSPLPRLRAGGSVNCPHFPSCLGLVEKTQGRPGTRRHCPPATINQPFILPLQSRESKSKRDKSARPTKDSEPRRKAGRVVGEGEAEAERKSWGPNKSPNQRSQGSDEGETGQAERSHVDTRQFSSQEGTGKKKMKHWCEWPREKAGRDPKWSGHKSMKRPL